MVGAAGAVAGALIQVHLGVLHKEAFDHLLGCQRRHVGGLALVVVGRQLLRVDLLGHCGHIQPRQVGALRAVGLNHRDLVVDVVDDQVVRAVHILVRLLQPLFALGDGRLIRNDTHGVEIGAVVDLHAREQVGVGRVEPRHLVRGEAKRLAGRLERQAVVDDGLVGEAGEGRVLLPLADPVAVNLVRQHNHAVLQADFTDAGEVFRRPAVAGGVLRVAQDEGVGVDADAALELLEVHRELAVDELQRHVLGLGLREREVGVETVIGRRLQQHLAALRRKRLQGRDQRRMHAGGQHHGGGVDVHAVALLVPGGDGLGDHRRRFAHVEVAPVLVLHPRVQGIGDARCRLEVDVGNAHADLNAALAVEADLLVELGGVTAEAVVNGVEVVFAVGGRLEGRLRRGHQRVAAPGCRPGESRQTGVSQK